jgi:mono/diheme cytochrome c family protein
MVRILPIVLLAFAFPSLSWAQEGRVEAGRAYANSACASCHAVRAGSVLSPNPAVPTFEKIANSPGITGVALYVILQSTHQQMPDFIIRAKEKADVVEYILSLKH